jgi:hypothetical protein
MSFATIDMLFDTVGLGEQVSRALRNASLGGPRIATPDFVTRFRPDGSLARIVAWQFNVDTANVDQLEVVLDNRVRSLGRLIAPTGFHTRLVLASNPRLELAPPIVCDPHIRHELGERPAGLREDVRLLQGNVRQSLLRASTVSLAIRVDGDGRVLHRSKR